MAARQGFVLDQPGSLPAAAIQPWADRIALWIRHHAVKAPTESVRYEIFNGGMAALASASAQSECDRMWGPAGGLSRPVLGPVQLLTPEVAIAVCHAGLPEAIGRQLRERFAVPDRSG